MFRSHISSHTVQLLISVDPPPWSRVCTDHNSRFVNLKISLIFSLLTVELWSPSLPPTSTARRSTCQSPLREPALVGYVARRGKSCRDGRFSLFVSARVKIGTGSLWSVLTPSLAKPSYSSRKLMEPLILGTASAKFALCTDHNSRFVNCKFKFKSKDFLCVSCVCMVWLQINSIVLITVYLATVYCFHSRESFDTWINAFRLYGKQSSTLRSEATNRVHQIVKGCHYDIIWTSPCYYPPF